MSIPTILLADNDEVFLHNTCEFIERRGYHVICATTSAQAREILLQMPIALAVIDIRLNDDDDVRDKSGIKLARETVNIQVPKIILTRFDNYEYAVDSLRPDKVGAIAVDFVVKQEGLEKLMDAIERILTKARIFLCYAEPDRERVFSLYDSLVAAGFAPWMDKRHIQGGERWEVAIRRAIRASDFFIVCLSNKSVNRRGFMQREIRIALEFWNEQLEDDIYMIPARLEDCIITNEKLRELQWVDLFNPGGFETLAQAVRTGTRRRFQQD